jgi:hypothetical protein
MKLSMMPLRATLLAALTLSTVAFGCAAPGQDEEADVGGAAVTTSTDPNRLVDTPYYFSVPKDAVTVPIDRQKYPYPTLWNASAEVEADGLRVIAIRQAGSDPASKKAARRDMAARLAQAGALEDGDVVLTFRPELAGTMAYPHIQMGITHAGLVYTQGGAAFNIDSPLDGQYVGQFDTDHYAGNGTDDEGTDALHIVRPRAMNDARRAQLRDWISTLKGSLPRFRGQRQQLMFQSDYLTPIYAAKQMTTRQTVTTLGKIILETDRDTKLPMFCSEFAWHMIALSSCTPDEIRSAPAEGAACVDEPFAPMPLVSSDSQVGLAEGPLLSILAAPADKRMELVPTIFNPGSNAGHLSSGHRAVAEQVAPLMAGLGQYYGARAQGATAEQAAPIAAQLNAGVHDVRNYSPTAFLVNSMQSDGIRKMDYVATVVFTDSAGYAKAKTLSHNPVP